MMVHEKAAFAVSDWLGQETAPPIHRSLPAPTGGEVVLPMHVRELLADVLPKGFDFDAIRVKKGLPFWASSSNAVTLGNSINIWDRIWGDGRFRTLDQTELLAHELYHVHQWRAFPLGQVPWHIAYALLMPAELAGEHPLEVPAYTFGEAFETALSKTLEAAGFGEDLKKAIDPVTGRLDQRFLDRWRKEINGGPAGSPIFMTAQAAEMNHWISVALIAGAVAAVGGLMYVLTK
jgi:hypothetical protein